MPLSKTRMILKYSHRHFTMSTQYEIAPFGSPQRNQTIKCLANCWKIKSQNMS